jgi:hypothetical protein
MAEALRGTAAFASVARQAQKPGSYFAVAGPQGFSARTKENLGTQTGQHSLPDATDMVRRKNYGEFS